MSTEEIKEAVNKKNYIRAASLAEDQGCSPEEIDSLRRRAIWEMAAVNRNAVGTRILSARYGFSREQLHNLLEEFARNESADNPDKSFKHRYDYRTDKHLDFSEWMEHLFAMWNKLPEENQ